MKKNISFLLGTILFIALLISCKKDDAPSSPVIQKWNIARHIDTTIHFLPPNIYIDYQPTTHSDYLDFRQDGKLYRLENSVMDTSTYILSHDTLIVHHNHMPDQTTFRIEVSTSDSLQLYGISYGLTNSTDYELTYYYLNR